MYKNLALIDKNCYFYKKKRWKQRLKPPPKEH